MLPGLEWADPSDIKPAVISDLLRVHEYEYLLHIQARLSSHHPQRPWFRLVSVGCVWLRSVAFGSLGFGSIQFSFVLLGSVKSDLCSIRIYSVRFVLLGLAYNSLVVSGFGSL